MSDALSFLALILALPLGFALLALSQDKQRRAIGLATPLLRSAAVFLRALGFGMIALALPVALWRDGGGFGSLLWMCLLPIAAFAITATLTWKPHWLRLLSWRDWRSEGSEPARNQGKEGRRVAR